MDVFYRNDIDEKLKRALWLLTKVTRLDQDLRRSKRYQGLLPNLSQLLGVSDPSSNHLKPVARLLFNNIKLLCNDLDCRKAAGVTDKDIRRPRRARVAPLPPLGATQGNYSLHLIYRCSHFNDCRPPTLAAGLSLGMTLKETADWVTTVTRMQRIET